MSEQPIPVDALLERIDRLGRELEQLKRDVLYSSAAGQVPSDPHPSLFGSVPSDDITDEMITAAQKSLFRPLTDL